MNMRKVLLTALLAALVCVPVVAQRPGGFGFGGRGGGDQLLANADVQKALKLTDEQKKAITKANEAMREAFRKAIQDKDREAMQAAGKEFGEALAKVKKDLKPEQVKRLLGIEAQVAEQQNQPRIFANADVQKALNFTEKQKEAVKELMTDMEKDVRELFQDAQGDREKFGAAMKKVQTMSKEAYTKINKTLTSEQKAAWKELKGEKVEIRLGGPGGFGRPGKRPEKKKDDI